MEWWQWVIMFVLLVQVFEQASLRKRVNGLQAELQELKGKGTLSTW